ncbi:hypothetical protein V5799_004247 [Amblyomma americanum]|uniref:Uncharacterized protein n=1 Tax=Amblyomma americanum TaxID=6943 RepID=A0AAQ4D6N1_AMBAM
MGRTFRKKRKTELAYGKQKRRPPTARKSRKSLKVIADEADSSNDGVRAPASDVSVPDGAPPSQPPSSDSDVALDPGPSTSYGRVPDNATEL